MNKAWFLTDFFFFFALHPHLPPPKFLLPSISYPFNLNNYYQVFHDFKSYVPNHVGVYLYLPNGLLFQRRHAVTK